MSPDAITIALWVAGGVGIVLFTITGFIAAHLFNKTIKLGERVTAHDIEIIQLRAQLLKAESDLRVAHDKDQGQLASAIAELKGAVQQMGSNIDSKMNTLHGRLDNFLNGQAQQHNNNQH